MNKYLKEDMVKKHPLVSIIVITYNSSKFVIEALDSTKEQTYQNIELIISDDASQDETVSICKKWMKENKDRFVRTRLITSEKNTGIPANLNRAYEAVRGEWIKGVAGDDRLISTCVEDNLECVNKNSNIEILFSTKDQYKDDFNSDNYLYSVPLKRPDHFFNDTISALEQYRMLLIKDRVGVSATLFIKKDLIYRVGMFDERFRFCDDYPLWLKLTKMGVKLYYMSKPTVMHRAHSGSVYNSKIDKVLINPSFFEREELREILVYPNISWKYRLGHYYNFYTSKLLVNIFDNKIHFISKISSKILLKYFNPLYWMDVNE